MRRLGVSTVLMALAAGAWLCIGAAATAKTTAKPQAKVGPPTFVVNLQWHMHQTSSDGENTADVAISNGVFVSGVGTQSGPQYHFGLPTAGTFTASARLSSSCWSQEESGSGPLTGQQDLMMNTAIRFFTYKGARLGVLQFPMAQIGIPVTGVTPGCNNTADRGPYKVGDRIVADASIPVPVLRCDGLPAVNQGGVTAAPGGLLSKSSPWTFRIACTTPGTPNADGSTTSGTITGTVSYTGPSPVLIPWMTAG